MIIESRRSKSDNLTWLDYLIFSIPIFISDDTFNFGTNNNYLFVVFKYCVYLVLTIFLLFNSNLRLFAIPSKVSLSLYLIIFSALITSIFNLDFSGGYLYQIWLFFLGILIVNYYNEKQLIHIYIKFIYWLSIISLIVFGIASVSLSYFEIFPVQHNSNEATVYNLVLCIVFADGSFVRNTSIFREPGVFMVYLSIAVLFELFYIKYINKLHLLVFIITIFTTLSTAAFIILGTIFIGFLFHNGNKISSFKTKFLVFFLILTTTVLILTSDQLFSLVFDKIGKENIADGSSLARGASILANFNIFLDNFIIGVGIKDFPSAFQQYTFKQVGISLDVGNNTNTITTIIAVYGFLFGLVFLYMIFNFANKISSTILSKFFIFLSLLMIFSNEDLRYSLTSSIFLMFGLTKLVKGKVINLTL